MKADQHNDHPAFELTMNLITGYLQNNKVPHNELNGFISQTFDAVLGIADQNPKERKIFPPASQAVSPATSSTLTSDVTDPPVKRGRGRPRLVRAEEVASSENAQPSLAFLAGDVIGTAPPKRRGRPPASIESQSADVGHAAPVDNDDPGASAATFNGIDPEDAIGHDQLTCLICGTQRKILTRHLSVDHNMTPDQYRLRFGLRADYPVTSEASSSKRSVLTKSVFAARRTDEGAEESGTEVPAAPAPVETAVKRGRGRPPKATSANEAKVVKRGRRKADESMSA